MTMTHAVPETTITTAPRVGAWLHHPVTGELARVAAMDADGRRAEAELWMHPGAAVAGAHIHDHVAERFTVCEGEVGFQVAGEERLARAGSPTVEVPAGTVHDWWNAGDGVARVRVEVLATPEAPGAPAVRFVGMIEALWSLGALGRVNAKGMPDPLWLAAIAREYRDAIRFVRPPAVVQTAVFGPLAAVARRTGRDPLAAELHGPQAACVIPDPSDEDLERLLGRRVGAGVARGRG